MNEMRLIDPSEARDFEEFWPYYLSQHLEPGTRKLHVVGTLAAAAVFAWGLLTRRFRRLLLAPLVGYAFAWTSHFAIEKNKPATVGNPLWSLQGDWRLLSRTLSGTIDADLSALRASMAAAEDALHPTASPSAPAPSETSAA